MADLYDRIRKKILDRAYVSDAFDQVRGVNKIVFTNGCFDILHAGHVQYLAGARSLGDRLFVGLNSDVSVRQLKGINRPVQKQEDRALILASLEAVDFVCIFDEETPLNLIQVVKPQVLVKGGDYDRKSIVGADFVESYGGRVATLDFLPGRSTTAILEKNSP